jgi:SAM-dependent methyltransferase
VSRPPRPLALVLAGAIGVAMLGAVRAQSAQEPYKPTVGQPGKDAVWVPSSNAVIEKMLDIAHVTPADYVIDLGSGDGRTVIAAAKRGARALGVEFNPDLVALSKLTAAKEGVGARASFVEGDMYAADISKATVLALFLLPQNLDRMVPKFLALSPGSRIVANTFGMTGWAPDERVQIEGDCETWCTALLWIIPAKAEGTWRVGKGELTLKQEFQMLSGTLSSDGPARPIEDGRMRGNEIAFTAGGARYAGKVRGNTIDGTVTTASGAKTAWQASRR